MSSSDLESLDKEDLEGVNSGSGQKGEFKQIKRKIPILEEEEDTGYRDSDENDYMDLVEADDERSHFTNEALMSKQMSKSGEPIRINEQADTSKQY